MTKIFTRLISKRKVKFFDKGGYMIWGIISDTHGDKGNAIPHIVAEFKKRNVELIIHCGDIETQHLNPELFGNLPVYCALLEEQSDKIEFKNPPEKWVFTRPKNRILDINGQRIYLGHKRSFDFLMNSEIELIKILAEIRKTNDNLRWLFSGHTHHQIYQQGIVNFINPGAIETTIDGYEFAVIDTSTGQVVFSRIHKTNPIKETFSIGVISDTLDISEMNPVFWEKLVKELNNRGVKFIVHCGNIAINDIGRKELCNFEVFYNLREDQIRKLLKTEKPPENWHLIERENPVVEINGYKFYVQLDLGIDLLEKSEIAMQKLCRELRRKYPEISFVLCGFTNDAFYEEGEQVRIVNPGDANQSQNMAVICLPRAEITFSNVPFDPLP
ncbi:MAG: metallophosphoesterase family protein [Candidatus Paceibacterota bacterium]